MLMTDLFSTGLDVDDDLAAIQNEIIRLKRKKALLSITKGVDKQKLATIGNLVRALKKQRLAYKINQKSGLIALSVNFTIATIVITMALATGRIGQEYFVEAFYTTAAVMVASRFFGSMLRGWVLWRTERLTKKITTLRRAEQTPSTSCK